MRRIRIVLAAAAAGASLEIAAAQTAANVEFGRDVLPLFRQNCVSCHGPSQQLAGLRLDRRSSVLKSGLRRVVPGSAANSFLYHRLVGNEYGMQMPPAGPLRPEQIEAVKTWIEQGAVWPDSLANEADLPPVNPDAVAMIDALRLGDLPRFLKFVDRDPKLLNARGPEGSTPFMYAVLYSRPDFLRRLLKRGADPNSRNDAQATPLMWAASDLEKSRLLLDHGAQANARSSDLRTPLMIAAGRSGGAPLVRLLLDRGANPNPNTTPLAESSPLVEAATAGDAASMELLIARGADIKEAAIQALPLAATLECRRCVDLLVSAGLDRSAYTVALGLVAVLGDPVAIRLMLDHGADVNAFDPLGRTPLMYAAGSDSLSLECVKLLVERGADVNAVNRHTRAGDAGLSVLDIARLHGNTPIVDFLVRSGAKGTSPPAPPPPAPRANSIRDALALSIPRIQAADAGFTQKSGCISCHNNSLSAMAVGLARSRGIPVDEQLSARQVKANIAHLEQVRDRLRQGFFVPVGDFFGSGIYAYILIGLHAEGYQADLNTDAAAMYIRMHQMSDGHWPEATFDIRPPLGSQYIGQTALAMRALQLYPPRTARDACQKSVRLAASWLVKAQPRTNDDRDWRLIGLVWAGASREVIASARSELLALQRPDGGWSDLPPMESTAYATGKAMVALQMAGLATTDPAYARGVRFLLDTQREDGSWHVKSRALAFQPYFEAGFPHGFDQWISAAGTSWAAMALAVASPSSRPRAALHRTTRPGQAFK